jgi:hypothetical protein
MKKLYLYPPAPHSHTWSDKSLMRSQKICLRPTPKQAGKLRKWMKATRHTYDSGLRLIKDKKAMPTLFLFFFSRLLSVRSGRAFYSACLSRTTLYRADHHTPKGRRALRSYALEPIRGLYAAMPVLANLLLLCSPRFPVRDALAARCCE